MPRSIFGPPAPPMLLAAAMACAFLGACTRPSYGGFNQPPAAGEAKQVTTDKQAAPRPAADKAADKAAIDRRELHRKTLAAAGRKPKEGELNTANAAILESKAVEVPRATRENTDAPPAEYLIGPRDELMISVEPHGTAGLPGISASERPTSGTDYRAGRTVVLDDGCIQLRGLKDDFKAEGLTVSQLSAALKEKYTKIIKDPEVIITIQSYKSKIAYLSGQFGKPGPMPLERRTDLLQLVSMAGNPAANANIRGAYVQRKNKEGKYRMLPVDLYALLEEGDISQNIWIQPDDFLYIPDNSRQIVYLLGNVNKTGPLPLHKDGTLNLLQAVVESGGIRSFGTDWDKVRIIRSHTPTRGEFIIVDYQKMVDGEAMPFPLQAGDIVYFANTRLGDWNEAVNAIQPSLQLVGNVLQPFVQMKVLQQTFKD